MPPARAASYPRWVSWLIALTPVFPPLYLVAFGALRFLSDLPRAVQGVLVFFLVTQLVAALLTPRPLLSLALAAARSLLVLAMISAGMYLKDSKPLRYLVWGYLAVFLIAWGFTLVNLGLDADSISALSTGRLSHPYYYIVSLGLLATISLWITVSWKGANPWWRFPLAAFSLVTLAATGSRGPLLALAVGAMAAVLVGHLRYLRIMAILGLTAIAAFGFIPALKNINPLERLATSSLSGRDEVWEGAIHAFRDSPLGGQGPYQIGPYLTYLYKDGCLLNPALEEAGVHCPQWLQPLHGAWLIAHNVVLHSLAETGVVGSAGLLALFLVGAVAIWRSRDGLLIAIFWGFLAMSMVDVVTAVPSPHFSELFWVCVGVALYRLDKARLSGLSQTQP